MNVRRQARKKECLRPRHRQRQPATVATLANVAQALTPSAQTRLSSRDLLLTLSVVTLLGFTFVPIKVGIREVPPFALAAMRFFMAGFPLVLFVKRPSVPWPYVVTYGMMIGVFQFGLLFFAIKLGMPAGLSSLVIQIQVFFTIALGVLLLRDKFRRHELIGALIAAAGIGVLAAYKIISGASATFVAFLIVIVAGLAWGVANIVAKRAAAAYRIDMFALVVWSSMVPPLPLAVLSYAFEGGPVAWHAVTSAGVITWLCVLTMAWGATLFGFTSWARLLNRYPTSLVSPFALLIPVSGLASGAWFLDESLAPVQYAGALLVLAGLAVNVYGPKMHAWASDRSPRV
jgi:O-acetylserine/cysteine efflux transporter